MVQGKYSSLWRYALRAMLFSVVAIYGDFLLSDTAFAATISVNTTNMTSAQAGNGVATECSFPDAIAAANTNTAVDGCTAGDPSSTATDTIVLPSGMYDASITGFPPIVESVTVAGSGVGVTTLKGVLSISPLSGIASAIHDISFDGVLVSYNANTLSTATSFDVRNVSLASSYISLWQPGDSHLTTTISNVTGTEAYIYTGADSSNPGDTTISNVTFDGNGSLQEAIVHTNARANDKVYVNNSVITNYAIGLSNWECQDNSNSSSVMTSLYVSNSSIGGGNMATGIDNTCGHLVVDATTFHNISGQAVYVEVNHASSRVDMLNNELISLTCYPESSSRLEITNSTFTAITPQAVGSQPAAVISLGAADPSYPTCPVPSLTTASSLTMKQNTIAGNTLGTSSDVFVSNGVTLEGITLQNNALEGNAISGAFTATTGSDSFGNMTTSGYAGPSFLAGAFRSVPVFQLSALSDNGGRAKVGYLGNSGNVLTMRPAWGSPLIDGSNDAGLAIDQRNETRSLLKKYDVGAVEVTRTEVLADGLSLSALSTYLDEPMLANTGASVVLVAAAAIGMTISGVVLYGRTRSRVEA